MRDEDLFSAAGITLPDAVREAPAPEPISDAPVGVESNGVEKKQTVGGASGFISPGGEPEKKPMTAAEKRLLSSAYGFCKYFLGIPVYDGKQTVPTVPRVCVGANGKIHYRVQEDTDWQKRVLDSIDTNGSRTSLVTANGSGKTSTIVAGSIIWHMFMFPNSLVISTAGVNRQVRSQLWPELERHAGKLEGWVFSRGSLEIKAPNGSRCVGFTTDDAGKAEGWHGADAERKLKEGEIDELVKSHKGPLYIIVDEAKSIPTAIFEAFDRCSFQRLLYCSSPGPSDGEFYKSQTHAAYRFTRFIIPARLCPHAQHAKNAETIAKRGEDHPLVCSSIKAEFMTNDASFVLHEATLAKHDANPPAYKGGTEAAFCDFAAGGDENVFAHRRGNKVRIVKAWTDKNTMSACAEFVRMFRQVGYTVERAHEIMGDADGLGTPMLDKLAELGWELTRCRNGERADNAEDYFNWGTETWLEGAKMLQDGMIHIEGLADDEELRAQLLGRKQGVVAAGNKTGAMRVEAKKDMQARGVGSPDRADAILGAMRKTPEMHPSSYLTGDRSRGRIEEALDDSGYDDGRDMDAIPGAYCG